MQKQVESKCPYLSIPINKALNVLTDQLNNDKNDLIKRTKLCLSDIYELPEFCLSKSYFWWNNESRVLKHLRSIRLSFVVVSSESYVQNLEDEIIAVALTLNMAQKTLVICW